MAGDFRDVVGFFRGQQVHDADAVGTGRGHDEHANLGNGMAELPRRIEGYGKAEGGLLTGGDGPRVPDYVLVGKSALQEQAQVGDLGVKFHLLGQNVGAADAYVGGCTEWGGSRGGRHDAGYAIGGGSGGTLLCRLVPQGLLRGGSRRGDPVGCNCSG